MANFSQALREARNSGLDKFQFNGNWYSTKTMEESKASQKVFKSKEGKGNRLAEVGVVAPYKKITSKTPGFTGKLGTDYNDPNGNTRVHFNHQNRMYYLTDNFGNIIGTSNDVKAANKGFTGWQTYNGSMSDLNRSGAAYSADRANMNETNQLAEQAQARKGKDFIQDIYDGQNKAGNVISNTLNYPTHATFGAIRLAADPDYTFKDYKRGLNVDKMQYDLGQTKGAGDAFGINNPIIREIANAGINAYTAPNILKSVASIKTPNFIQAGRNLNAAPLKANITEAPNASLGAKGVTGTKQTFTAGKGYSNTGGSNIKGSNGTKKAMPGMGNLQGGVQAKSPAVTPTKAKFQSAGDWQMQSADILPNRFLNNTNQRQVLPKQEDLPFYTIDYVGSEGNATQTGRAITGDFVPGTTAKNWQPNTTGKAKSYNSQGVNIDELSGNLFMPTKRSTSTQDRQQTASHIKVNGKDRK